MTAADAPSSDALRAPASPPEPPPITRKSKRVMSVDDGSEAILLRTTPCLQNAEKSRCLRLKRSCTRVRRMTTAITRKLADAGRVRSVDGRAKLQPLLCHYELQQWCVNPGNSCHNSHGDPHGQRHWVTIYKCSKSELSLPQ